MDVALVGLVLPNVENHSLGALRHAALREGFHGAVVPFLGWPQMREAIATIRSLNPRVCGISIQSTESALPSLSLARLLRASGYRGRIVAGGHFATLNAEEILAAPAEVDAVVRFAGEEALVGMLRDPGGDSWASLPGIVFRDETGATRHGAPAVVRGEALVSAPGRDGRLPEHLGFAAADLVVSRGCEARCAYCCVAGASEIARHELSGAGGAPQGPVYDRRGLEAIADEIASLHHDRDARVFTFMDDNVLPLDPDDAAAWARALHRHLVDRRVGRIALSLQVRADAISDEAADALVELGVVRAYVGIDGYSSRQLKQLGRGASADAGPAALSRLAARGVHSVCNALLLGPTIGFDSILDEIEALARIRHAPVHLLPIDVRRGTRYAERAEARGLVEGGFLFRHTRFEDPRTEQVASLLTSLPSRLEERSVPIALYDLGYNLGIALRLVPGADVAAARAVYATVTEKWNADQIRVLRLSAEAARAGREGAAAIEALRSSERERVRAHDDALRDACDQALLSVERAVSRALRRGVRAHTRGRLLSSVAFAMGLAACDQEPLQFPSDGAAHPADQSAFVGDLAPPPDLASTDLATIPDFAGIDAAACPPDRKTAAWDPQSIPEFWCNGRTCAYPDIELQFDGAGMFVAASYNNKPLSMEVADCIAAFFAPYCYPSLANQKIVVKPHCWIA